MEHSMATRRVRRILDHVSRSHDIPPQSPNLPVMISGSCVSAQQNLPSKCPPTICRDSSYLNQREPLVSTMARLDVNLFGSRDVHLLNKDHVTSSSEAYGFSGTNAAKACEQPDFGFVWSPRIDVIESCSNYFLIVELPGVNINGIRVEVDDKSLTVTGRRVMQWHWNTKNCSVHTSIVYHKREILQGPYEVVWPLPKDVNRDCISAEFVDGFLRIEIPKI